MSKLLIIILAALVIFSCKKENEIWNPEDHLLADTAIAIQELKIINQTPTELTFELELVRLNGGQSEEAYTDLNVSFQNDYYIHTILAESIVSPTSTNEYSTIALFQSSNTSFYEGGKLSFGLRRFFETVDQSPNKKIAIVSRRKDDNLITVHKSGGDPFANSATFNNGALHELILANTYSPNNGTGEGFRDQMLAAIALFDECVSCSGQKSIIIFDDQDENYYANFDPTDSIIAVANAANVQINIVVNGITSSYGDLALKTGGIIMTRREGSFVVNGPVFSRNSLATLVQSMDGFLSQSLNKHHYSFTLVLSGGAVLATGDLHSVNFVYSDQRFEVVFRVP